MPFLSLKRSFCNNDVTRHYYYYFDLFFLPSLIYLFSHLGIEDEEASKLWQVIGSSSKVISQFELPDRCSRMYLTCYFYTPWKHQEVRDFLSLRYYRKRTLPLNELSNNIASGSVIENFKQISVIFTIKSVHAIMFLSAGGKAL